MSAISICENVFETVIENVTVTVVVELSVIIIIVTVNATVALSSTYTCPYFITILTIRFIPRQHSSWFNQSQSSPSSSSSPSPTPRGKKPTFRDLERYPRISHAAYETEY